MKSDGKSIPKLGIWVAVILTALAATAIIVDLSTGDDPQQLAKTPGLHPDARGPAARRKPIVAALADDVYYYNPTPEARAIPIATLIGYNTLAAAEADGINPSANAAAMTADLDRIEIKRGLRKGVLFEFFAALSDDLSDLGDLGESDKIFFTCGVPEFNILADGIVAIWPMELLDAASGERVFFRPVWTHLARSGGTWVAASTAAKAIESGRLATKLTATGRLAAAREMGGRVYAATGAAAFKMMFVTSRDSDRFHLSSCPLVGEIPEDGLLGFCSLQSVESTGRTNCPLCISRGKRNVAQWIETRRNDTSLAFRLSELDKASGGPNGVTITCGRPDVIIAADGASTITMPLTITDAKRGEQLQLSPRWALPAGGDGWRAANAAAEVISDGRLSAELPLESVETVRRLVGLEVKSP